MKKKNKIITRIKCESYIAKFSHMYELKLSGAYNNGEPFVYQMRRSVGEFYTSEGQLVITEVEEVVGKFLNKIKNL